MPPAHTFAAVAAAAVVMALRDSNAPRPAAGVLKPAAAGANHNGGSEAEAEQEFARALLEWLSSCVGATLTGAGPSDGSDPVASGLTALQDGVALAQALAQALPAQFSLEAERIQGVSGAGAGDIKEETLAPLLAPLPAAARAHNVGRVRAAVVRFYTEDLGVIPGALHLPSVDAMCANAAGAGGGVSGGASAHANAIAVLAIHVLAVAALGPMATETTRSWQQHLGTGQWRALGDAVARVREELGRPGVRVGRNGASGR